MRILEFNDRFPDENSCREHFRIIKRGKGYNLQEMCLRKALLAKAQMAMAVFKL